MLAIYKGKIANGPTVKVIMTGDLLHITTHDTRLGDRTMTINKKLFAKVCEFYLKETAKKYHS